MFNSSRIFKYFSIVFIVMLFSCEKRKFDNLEFDYNDIGTYFSMKFNRSDTVYVEESPLWGSSKKYYIIFNRKERKTLDSFSNMLITKNFDSIYDRNFNEESNIKYSFSIQTPTNKGNNIKNISVHEKWATLDAYGANYYAPEDLRKFSLWLYYRKQKSEKHFIE